MRRRIFFSSKVMVGSSLNSFTSSSATCTRMQNKMNEAEYLVGGREWRAGEGESDRERCGQSGVVGPGWRYWHGGNSLQQEHRATRGKGASRVDKRAHIQRRGAGEGE